MKNSILSIDGLSTGYAAKGEEGVIARGLTASLPPSSVTALVGVNGVGKSTLLRTLAGLQPPLAGTVCWLGKKLEMYSPKALAKTIAVVLTERPAVDGLTAREVVEMGRIPYTGIDGRLSEADHSIVADAMRQTGTSCFEKRMLVSLSDGERERVMIAKALAQQTPAILLDEPTAFLDFPGKVDMLRLLCRLARDCGKAILLSTHDLEIALQMVSRLWLLSGEGIIEGTPRELAADGSVGRFFNSDGVEFCPETMRFEVRVRGVQY